MRRQVLVGAQLLCLVCNTQAFVPSRSRPLTSTSIIPYSFKLLDASPSSASPSLSTSTKRHRQRDLSKGAYSNLSEEELYTKTINHLATCNQVGNMTGNQIQETGKLLVAWSKRRVMQSGEMSESLLRRLVDEKVAGNEKARPSVNHFNSCMNAWIKCGRAIGYQKAIELLKDLNIYLQTHDNVPNDDEVSKCYGTVIAGCIKNKSRSSADLACEILEKMDSGREVKHYNSVMNAYASLYDHKAVLRIFQKMKEMSNAGEENVRPNRTTYNIVIKSLSGCQEMKCIRMAERILAEMENSHRKGVKNISPDRISYTSMLTAWSRVCTKQSVDKAEMYLQKMTNAANKGNRHVRPDTVTYNAILNIIANSNLFDSGRRSLKILSKMEKLYELGDRDLKPNVISYNAVIKAFSKNTYSDGARRALIMLKKLENDDDLKPDIISYNSCLNAFAKARDPMSAQLLLDRMENMYANGYHVKPDTYSYNTVISAWAFSDHEHAAEIAETIFERMETSQIRLDTTTFNTLLSAWGRQRDPERAADILHHMFTIKKSGVYDVRPTTQSFAIVINAWAKTKYPKKAFKAKGLLNEMKERSKRNKKLRPNSYIYASVLNACAFSFGSQEVRQEALSIAIDVFKECRCRNDVIYGTFIKACKNLIDDDDDKRRVEMIQTAFLQCRQKGLVSDFVLYELFSSLSTDQYNSILECETEDLVYASDLPKEWSRNITKK